MRLTDYKWENMNILRRCLRTASDDADVTWSGRSFHVLTPETGKARLPTIERRTGGTIRRWEAEDRNRCLDITSVRQLVKHDCRYPVFSDAPGMGKMSLLPSVDT